jgi:hypothetical protein
MWPHESPSDWLINCCWASSAQWFLVPITTGFMTLFLLFDGCGTLQANSCKYEIIHGVGWDLVHLVHQPLIGLLYQSRVIDDYGAFGGMRIDRGNLSIRTKLAPVPLCPPLIPYDRTYDRTRAAALGNCRLTAWAMERPHVWHKVIQLKGLSFEISNPNFEFFLFHLYVIYIQQSSYVLT